MKAVKNWNLEKGQWLTRKLKTDEEKAEKKMEGGKSVCVGGND